MKCQHNLAHGHRGRRAPNTTPDSIKAEVLSLARTTYSGGIQGLVTALRRAKPGRTGRLRVRSLAARCLAAVPFVALLAPPLQALPTSTLVGRPWTVHGSFLDFGTLRPGVSAGKWKAYSEGEFVDTDTAAPDRSRVSSVGGLAVGGVPCGCLGYDDQRGHLLRFREFWGR